MRPSVLSAWRKWNQPNEGWLPFMYTDDAPVSAAFPNGIVTVGMGNALESVEAAQAAGFTDPDGSPSDPTEVAAQWEAVRQGPRNSSSGAGYLTTVRLSDAAILALVGQTVAANEGVLRGYFPGWDDLPADAQAAIMSMAWAMGPGFPATFTNFTRAINAGDWDGAIASHAYHGVGTQNRQAQELVALANAKAVQEQSLDPATLYWPGDASTAIGGALAKIGPLVLGTALVVGAGAALEHFRPALFARALGVVKGWWS